MDPNPTHPHGAASTMMMEDVLHLLQQQAAEQQPQNGQSYSGGIGIGGREDKGESASSTMTTALSSLSTTPIPITTPPALVLPYSVIHELIQLHPTTLFAAPPIPPPQQQQQQEQEAPSYNNTGMTTTTQPLQQQDSSSKLSEGGTNIPAAVLTAWGQKFNPLAGACPPYYSNYYSSSSSPSSSSSSLAATPLSIFSAPTSARTSPIMWGVLPTTTATSAPTTGAVSATATAAIPHVVLPCGGGQVGLLQYPPQSLFTATIIDQHQQEQQQQQHQQQAPTSFTYHPIVPIMTNQTTTHPSQYYHNNTLHVQQQPQQSLNQQQQQQQSSTPHVIPSPLIRALTLPGGGGGLVAPIVDLQLMQHNKHQHQQQQQQQQQHQQQQQQQIFDNLTVLHTPPTTNIPQQQQQQQVKSGLRYVSPTNSERGDNSIYHQQQQQQLVTMSNASNSSNNSALSPVDAIIAAAAVIAKRRHSITTTTTAATATTNSFSANQQHGTVKKKKKYKKSSAVAAMSFTNTSATINNNNYTNDENENDDERVLFLCTAINTEKSLHRTLLLHMALESREIGEGVVVVVVPATVGGGGVHGRTTTTTTLPLGGRSSTTMTTMDMLNDDDESSTIISTNYENVGGEKKKEEETMMIIKPMSRAVIKDGFFWKDYPELESILQRNMEEYYEMSENCPQSLNQQEFNNRLAKLVHTTACQAGYIFDPISFGGGPATTATATTAAMSETTTARAPTTDDDGTITTAITASGRSSGKKNNNSSSKNINDTGNSFNFKKLRDRIRCYYKTHIQNSKKRLTTILKHPTKARNKELLLRMINELKVRAHLSSGCNDSLAAAAGDGQGDGVSVTPAVNSTLSTGGLAGRRELCSNGKAVIRWLVEYEYQYYESKKKDNKVCGPATTTADDDGPEKVFSSLLENNGLQRFGPTAFAAPCPAPYASSPIVKPTPSPHLPSVWYTTPQFGHNNVGSVQQQVVAVSDGTPLSGTGTTTANKATTNVMPSPSPYKPEHATMVQSIQLFPPPSVPTPQAQQVNQEHTPANTVSGSDGTPIPPPRSGEPSPSPCKPEHAAMLQSIRLSTSQLF